eukprot:8528266-Alexandrium_andersonii.AAC.1
MRHIIRFCAPSLSEALWHSPELSRALWNIPGCSPGGIERSPELSEPSGALWCPLGLSRAL